MITENSGPSDLTSQTAIVTGAAGGIGAATCEALAREGADIIATDIDEDGLEETGERVSEQGSACTTIAADITKPDDISDISDVAFGEHESIEILVSAHGVVRRHTLSEITLEEWETTLAVNLTGTMLITQMVYDHFKDNTYGKIVCIGSISGKIGGVISGPSYVASKGAFTRSSNGRRKTLL